ncbi:MAG: hypothetical protein Q4G40_02540 [Brachybacterium sp.]|nr:hypothetical protein [Brachybacterium sp.]
MLTLLLVVVFSLVGAPAAYACDCDPLTFEEAIEAADLIADVTVQQEVGRSDDGWGVTYEVAVNTVWKGEQTRTVRFTTAEDIPACGLGRLHAGDSLLIWASGADGEYSSTWCALPMDGTTDDRERLTDELGEPADLTDEPVTTTAPSEPPAVSGSGVSTSMVLVLAVIGIVTLGLLSLAVAVTVVVLVLRRRPPGG